jgi:transposase/transposase IS116/IS110/IS902 family protein
MVFVGVDWSEKHHEVELQDSSGKVLKRLRVGADLKGLRLLQETLTEAAEEPGQVVIGIEATQGLLVNFLVGSGYQVLPVNPLLSARSREAEAPAKAKSDRGDAHLLTNLVRTRRQDLRPLAGDSEDAQVVRIRAHSHARLVRHHQRLRSQLRSALSKFFPAAVSLLGEEETDLRDALAVLSVAANPELARRLSINRLRSLLASHGRQRNLDLKAAQIQALLRSPQPQLNSPRMATAYGDEVRSLVRVLLGVRAELIHLEAELTADFEMHPDAEIYFSLPGLGFVLGARVLGEMGDDPTRFQNAKSRKNFAGNAPITRASGKYRAVFRRIARNRLLADSCFLWANSAISGSPGARRYYDQLRGRGNTHNEACRALANRLIGILHGCLRTRRPYEESLAWTTTLEEAA